MTPSTQQIASPQGPGAPAPAPAAGTPEPAAAGAPAATVGPRGSAASRHRRVIQLLAPLGLALLVVGLLIALTSTGGGEAPPATGAAAFVPADALLYVHLSTDPSRPAVTRAQRLLARLPDRGAGLTSFAQRLVAVVGGAATTQYGRDIRPWIGADAAFALLNSTGASAGSVIVAQVRNRRLATRFIDRAGARPAGSYDGSTLYGYSTGAELAFARGYLVVGTDPSVRAALDAGRGRTRSLLSDPAYARASAGEPAARVLDAYISAAGVTRVLGPRQGILGALGALVSQPALRGTAVAVSAESPGLRVWIHSALDPALAREDANRLQAFTPTLQNVLPASSTLMLDGRNLSAIAPTVLAATSKVGLLSGVPELLRRLGGALTAEGVNVKGFLNLFRGETAVALARGSGAPALVIVTRTRDEAAARLTLAGLVPPLMQVFSPTSGGGIEPEAADVPTAGVTAHQVQLGPGLQVDYAVFRGLIVISTSLRGIGDVAAGEPALGGSRDFAAALGGRPAEVTSLGFADFSQLLSLAEQTTLARSAGFRDLRADLGRIRTVGMQTTRGEADTTAELFLHIP